MLQRKQKTNTSTHNNNNNNSRRIKVIILPAIGRFIHKKMSIWWYDDAKDDMMMNRHPSSTHFLCSYFLLKLLLLHRLFLAWELLLCILCWWLLLRIPPKTFDMLSYPSYHVVITTIHHSQFGRTQFIVQWNKTEYHPSIPKSTPPSTHPPRWMSRDSQGYINNIKKIEDGHAG